MKSSPMDGGATKSPSTEVLEADKFPSITATIGSRDLLVPLTMLTMKSLSCSCFLLRTLCHVSTFPLFHVFTFALSHFRTFPPFHFCTFRPHFPAVHRPLPSFFPDFHPPPLPRFRPIVVSCPVSSRLLRPARLHYSCSSPRRAKGSTSYRETRLSRT